MPQHYKEQVETAWKLFWAPIIQEAAKRDPPKLTDEEAMKIGMFRMHHNLMDMLLQQFKGKTLANTNCVSIRNLAKCCLLKYVQSGNMDKPPPMPDYHEHKA
ncbi:hypothetical protein SEMRO_1001_G229790.1 [Seminavis robusta]|uniref:Uncharacterized protein n=1 Tax=Seminavis robusta TaxID=568900 RepID=A0A9N8EH89_9STRA|nr:hypothetical protein SEMRO_1001_G229790.1 [Seminavis robusta]|eukprot:Sro1001_g229790.1 n/a (102) ;mRNA; r:11847-12152